MLNSLFSNDSSVVPSSESALDSLKASSSSPSFYGLSFDQVFMKLIHWHALNPAPHFGTLGTKTHIPPLVP